MDKLFSAMNKVQAELSNVKKESVNPFFNSRYVDLASVLDSIREPITKHGLCIIQTTERRDGVTGVVTNLCHISGESISGFLPIHPKDNSAQAVGSAITYARRYALMAICGVAGEDDDGNHASGNTSQHKPIQPQPHHISNPPLQPMPRQAMEMLDEQRKLNNIPMPEGLTQIGATLESWDELKNLAPTPEEMGIGDYTVGFGKYVGKRLRDIEAKELSGYYTYLCEKAASDGKQPAGKVREFLLSADKYLRSRPAMRHSEGPDESEDIQS